MQFARTRFALCLLGDRLVGAAVRGPRADVFVVEAEHASAALRAELDQRRLAPRTAALGLPRAAVTVKPLELPGVAGDLREMVRFELERHLPFPADDAPFDVLPLPSTEPGVRRVLVVAAERRVLDRALRSAEEVRVRPRSLTVAVHDLLTLARLPRRGFAVWAHRVDESVELLFLAAGALVLSRALPTADPATAAAEIRRTLPVLRWRRLDAVWVSGDAWPEGVRALLELGAPVARPPYAARARRLLEQLDEPARGARELALAVAVGRGERPLDLLPPGLRPRRLSRAQLVTGGLGALTAVLAAAALLAPGWRDSRHLAALDRQLAALEPEVRAVEQVVRELERQRRLLAAIETAQATSLRPLPVLREMTELLPADAWLTTLTLDAKGVELTGQAAAAAALIPLLENSPRFERVEFASPVTRGRDREQFRIRAAWEGRPAVAAAPAGGVR
mgnify:CR=1 FL=1